MFFKASIVITATLLFSPLASAANQQEVDSLRDQIRELTEQSKQQTEFLQEQRKHKAELEKQVDCTWKLVQVYEGCDAEHDKTSAEYLDCINKGKEENKQCMDAPPKAAEK